MTKINTDKNRLILAMLIFGSIGVVRRYIPFSSAFIVLVRAFVGLVFLLAVRMIKRESINLDSIKNNLLKLIILGVLLAANWICLFEAYNYTSVSAATMCYYMAPVFVMLLSPIIFGESFSLKKAVCAVCAVFGMVLVSGVLGSELYGARGLILGLAAAAMYAAIVILNKTLKNISAPDRTIAQFAVAFVCMLPYVLLTENLAELRPTGFEMLMLLIAGIVHTGFAYTLYFGSIASVPAQTAALLSYVDPVTAVILSVTLLREPMSISAVAGAILVIGAMIISENDIRLKKAA